MWGACGLGARARGWRRDAWPATMAQARNALAISVYWGVMVSPLQRSTSRRRVLQFLVASPMFSHMSRPARAQDARAPLRVPDPLPWAPRDPGKLIGEPKEALSVFDFEPVMKNTVPAAHFGYMATGLDDEVTLRTNREAFLHYQLRPRRLVDVSNIDMSSELVGAI